MESDKKIKKKIDDMGTLISSDTTWQDHIVMVVAKDYKMLGFLRRN